MIVVSGAKILQSHVSSQQSLQIKTTTHVGRQFLFFAGGICKAFHPCKCLTLQDLIHGKTT